MRGAPSDLTGFLCWDVDDVQRVLDVDALAVAPSVFRAVHHPVSFVRRDSLPSDETGVYRSGPGLSYGEEAFLEDLLDPRTSYQLVSVIGPSGAGKSHLIRWLHVRITEAAEGAPRRVILVPRAGTNLRAVLRMILEGMEGAEFEEFRDRLGRADDTVSPEVGRGRLLEGLAERIEHGEAEALATALPEHPATHVTWVREAAPAFLRDDVFRKEWLRPDGVLARLYDLALGSASEVDRAEERRGMTESDLPLDIDPRAVPKASQASQTFYNHLTGGHAALNATLLAVLNHYIEDAVRALLQVRADDLTDLLREVRRALAREGRELVLLIEDVARLQGIDRQLLDGLLERPEDRSGEGLCPLRAVVGCTTGYFETLPNTFRTRCAFIVDLKEQRGRDDSDAVVPMASRYLNAARLGRAALAAWHQGWGAGGAQRV